MSAEQLPIIQTKFFDGQFKQGLQIAKESLKKQPSSELYSMKALFEYQLGQTSQAIADLGQALVMDPLNHHAYFNLFSIYYCLEQYEMAFKNLCCALSVAHLLIAHSEKGEEHIQKAIEYSFNNKQARALKSVFKLQQNKRIESLNMINYALYLDPSNPHLCTIQQKVYQKMGMKELKGQTKPQKAKFQRLDTCKQVPSEDKLQEKIDEMMKEFNQLLRKIAEEDVYIVQTNKQAEPIASPNPQQPVIRWIETKAVSVKPSDNFDSATTVGVSHQKSYDSARSETSIGNECSFAVPQAEAIPFSDVSFSKMDSISISNISQNSKIKLSKVNNRNVLDISECVINMLSEANNSKFLPEDSMNGLNESTDSQKVELKLPIDSIKGLAQNQKLVLAIQRVKINQKGEKEEVEQLYEIVANNKGIQLVKSQPSD